MTAAGFCSAASRFAAAGSEQLCASEASNIEIVFGLICRFSMRKFVISGGIGFKGEGGGGGEGRPLLTGCILKQVKILHQHA